MIARDPNFAAYPLRRGLRLASCPGLAFTENVIEDGDFGVATLAGTVTPSKEYHDGRFCWHHDQATDNAGRVEWTNDPQTPASSNWTLSCWVNTGSDPWASGEGHTAFMSHWNSSQGIILWAHNTNRSLRLGDNSSALVAVTNELDQVNDGAWHHICGTYGPTNATLYRDGVQKGQAAVGTIANHGTAKWTAGGYGDGTSGTFNGRMTDIFIWDRGLSAGEVAQLYADPWAPLRSFAASATLPGVLSAGAFTSGLVGHIVPGAVPGPPPPDPPATPTPDIAASQAASGSIQRMNW